LQHVQAPAGEADAPEAAFRNLFVKKLQQRIAQLEKK